MEYNKQMEYKYSGKTIRFEPKSVINSLTYDHKNHKYHKYEMNKQPSFKIVNKRKKTVKNVTSIKATTWKYKNKNSYVPGERKVNNKKIKNFVKLHLYEYMNDIYM
jgi:hypothetical protein